MHVLISAGPTREKIDPVRFISNRSSGRMGYALAAAAVRAGHRVTLVSGPVALPCPEGAKRISVESAAEMAAAIRGCADDADVIIMAAAVADYRPVVPESRKMKKQPGELVLKLERTEDILAALGQSKRPGQILVGFAAETDDLECNALDKLRRKNLDWIAANWVRDGFGTPDNALVVFHRGGERHVLENSPKEILAARLLRLILPD
ncbi:MAG: phosphopantothenoylcysteine decarboxylase [Lentisphaeria bacterium]|nr:phosphopantothenoylcysteine decarboxylase [Lentisphaeria bacterium]